MAFWRGLPRRCDSSQSRSRVQKKAVCLQLPKESLAMKFNLVLLLFLAQVAQAATPVLTRSYDNGRTGANTTETTFTPQLVAAKGLRKLKSLSIPDDPRVEAQPLYVPGVRIQKDNQLHNVVFVASMGNH